MVYVRPGKDVTLYVPSDTPQEVCDYLNTLKEQGMFSSGVIEIITNYVQSHPELALSNLSKSVQESAGTESARVHSLHTDVLPPVAPFSGNDEDISSEVEVENAHGIQEPGKRRLSLTEIFSQAKKNSLDKL